jgi:hypothetical protein
MNEAGILRRAFEPSWFAALESKNKLSMPKSEDLENDKTVIEKMELKDTSTGRRYGVTFHYTIQEIF